MLVEESGQVRMTPRTGLGGERGTLRVVALTGGEQSERTELVPQQEERGEERRGTEGDR